MTSARKHVFGRKMLIPVAALLALMLVALAVVLLFTGSGQAGDSPYDLESNVTYGPANGQPGTNQLDIYTPKEESATPRPVFVWIHGGGWFTGDKVNGIVNKAKTLVDAGYVFVSVNYRLSPDLKGPQALSKNRLRFPAHTLDAAKALGWVNKNISQYNGDSKRMLIGGDSAGGQISSLLATKPIYLKNNGMSNKQIKGVFSLDSVGFNVPRMMTPAYKRINGGFQRMMFNAFGTPAEEKQKPSWAAASPIRFADRSDPPIFFVVPTTSPDRWVDAQQMAARLGQRLNLVSHRVRTEHAGVVPLLGNPAGDMGVTAPLMRFAKAAIEPTRIQPRIVGKRVVSSNGAVTGVVRLQISSVPAARQITCRLGKGPERPCAPSWRLRVGKHQLRVNFYDGTGKAAVSRLVNLRVTR